VVVSPPLGHLEVPFSPRLQPYRTRLISLSSGLSNPTRKGHFFLSFSFPSSYSYLRRRNESPKTRLARSAEAAAAAAAATPSGAGVSWMRLGLPDAAAKQVEGAMSPLLAALLRQNPTQWAAAGDALAHTARAAMARQQRHFSLGKWLRSSSPASAQSTAAFSKVWAEAGRFAYSGAAAVRVTAATTAATATASRVAAMVVATMPRAPSALFLLGHHAQNTAVARRLPNLSGVMVLMVIGRAGALLTALFCSKALEKPLAKWFLAKRFLAKFCGVNTHLMDDQSYVPCNQSHTPRE
jgi:hypothetical protein